MTDTSYESVLSTKREEILVNIERLRSEAAEITSRLAMREAQLKNIDDLLAIERGGPAPKTSIDDEQRADRRGASLVDQAANVLRDAGKPTHYRQLVGLL